VSVRVACLTYRKYPQTTIASVSFPAFPDTSKLVLKSVAHFEQKEKEVQERSLEIVSQFPASIEMSVELRDIEVIIRSRPNLPSTDIRLFQNVGDLFVEVMMPTGRVCRIHPPSAHFAMAADRSSGSLKTTLPLRFEKWSGPAPVRLNLALEFQPDQLVPDLVMIRKALDDRSTEAEKFAYMPLEATEGAGDSLDCPIAYTQLKIVTL